MNVPSDPSVVHVPQEEMSYQQALQWRDSIHLAGGRRESIQWLLSNDPVICGMYRRLESAGIDGGDRHLAAVLLLVNMMRSGNDKEDAQQAATHCSIENTPDHTR